jgi:hypothetical protein
LDLKEENHKTRDSIDPKLNSTPSQRDRECRSATSRTFCQQEPTCSSRPRLTMGISSINDTKYPIQSLLYIPRVVINVEPQLEIQGMSSTVDKSCFTYLTTHSVTGTSKVRLRHIDSGEETNLQVSHPELIVSLEGSSGKQSPFVLLCDC